MALQVVFELTEIDLQHLQTMMEEARQAASELDENSILDTASRNLVEKAREAEMPEFIEDRLRALETLIRMVRDPEWQLPDEDRRRVVDAVSYFATGEDLIPDRIPGLGFLDDAIMIELVARDLRHEIDAYHEFCIYRDVETQRRVERGEPTNVGRENWLADRRAALQSRMRSRRRSSRQAGGWRLSSW